jgi:uncharacterized ion transporter superfamily protein YfcC
VLRIYQEIVAFLPLLCGLMSRIGLDGETGLALSVGSASVASSFSPFNTFSLGISQPMAALPLFSGFGFRTAFVVAAVIIWIGYTLRHARRSLAAAAAPERTAQHLLARWRRSDIAVLTIMNAGIALLVAGAITRGWELPQFSAVFVVIAFAAGLTGGLGLRGVSESMAEGFRRMAYASLLIGFARAISVVLANGAILDTIAKALFTPLRHGSAARVLMLLSESVLSLPMPSDSGKAMMSLPIMIPLADLLGLSRQMVVTAFQYSGVISGLAVPTAGSLLAILAVAGVSFRRWLRFVTVPVVLLIILVAGAIAIGVTLRIQ